MASGDAPAQPAPPESAAPAREAPSPLGIGVMFLVLAGALAGVTWGLHHYAGLPWWLAGLLSPLGLVVLYFSLRLAGLVLELIA